MLQLRCRTKLRKLFDSRPHDRRHKQVLTSSLPWFLRRSSHSKMSLCHGSRYTAKAPLRLPPPWSTYLHHHHYEHKQHNCTVSGPCMLSDMIIASHHQNEHKQHISIVKTRLPQPLHPSVHTYMATGTSTSGTYFCCQLCLLQGCCRTSKQGGKACACRCRSIGYRLLPD